MSAKPPSDSSSILSRWMGVGDANTAGNVHGGVILHMCDEVAGIAAVRHCGLRVVTAGMDRMTFRHPVFVGALVTVRATVNAAWRTSMEVACGWSRRTAHREVTHTSAAYLTMVALDEEGRPTAIPPVSPETADEQRRARGSAAARQPAGGAAPHRGAPCEGLDRLARAALPLASLVLTGELHELREALAAEPEAHPHDARALAARPRPQPERGEDRALVLQPYEIGATGQTGVEPAGRPVGTAAGSTPWSISAPGAKNSAAWL